MGVWIGWRGCERQNGVDAREAQQKVGDSPVEGVS